MEILTPKESHIPKIQPQKFCGLRPAADRLTDVQVFLQDPGLARGGSFSVWPGLCPHSLFIQQHMLAQHIKAAPIFHVHFRCPLTLISCLLQRSHPYGLQGEQLWFFFLWTFEPNSLTLPPSYPLAWIRWPTVWWSVTSVFCKAGSVFILPSCSHHHSACMSSVCPYILWGVRKHWQVRKWNFFAQVAGET